jgi:beta-glucosidase
VPMEALDEAVRRILRIVSMAADGAKSRPMPDVDSHHAIARSAAADCMVLLKNDGDILPLSKKGKIAIIGEMARAPRYQGGGSSHVNPSRLDNVLQEAVRLAGKEAEIRFAAGYPKTGDAADPALLEEARGAASWADVAVVFIGLPEEKESEGFDRPGLGIPQSHSALVEAVCGVQSNTVVVLSNGSPIGMPWISRPRAVLEGYLGGQAGGGAVVEVLFGEVNPSGKLAESFPMRLEDTPAYLNFPGEKRRVEYREGIFVGYRFYDAVGIEPLFPFGHGLSYTRFEYSDLELDRTECLDTEGLAVSVKVKNSGRIPGKEVVQLYVGAPAEGVIRPPKELAGFEKIHLEAGERKTVRFKLDARSFAFWDRDLPGWRVESGIHRILVGSSSRDIRLQAEAAVKSTTPRSIPYDHNTSLGELRGHPLGARLVSAGEKSFLAQFGGQDPDSPEARMMRAMADELPIRNLVRMGKGGITRELLNDMIAALNGKPQSEELKEFLR